MLAERVRQDIELSIGNEQQELGIRNISYKWLKLIVCILNKNRARSPN